MVYICSSIVLRHKSHKTLAYAAYAQQKLRHGTDQILYMVATLQLLTLVFACLLTSIMLFNFQEVASCLARGMNTLQMLCASYSAYLGVKTNHNFGPEFGLAD